MSSKYKAFTLIELLVVIAVVSLLIAITVPALRGTRACARRVVSASNMRQIGLAISMYADNNKGSFPQTSHGGHIDRSWIFTLEEYLEDVDKVRICPADPKRAERLANNGTSYVLNEYIAVELLDPFGNPVGRNYTNMYELRSPVDTITTFVGADDLGINETADHTHSRSWFIEESDVWEAICHDIQPDRYRAGPQAENKTRGTSHYLYADGHLETVKAEEIKRKADAFDNFAEPPY